MDPLSIVASVAGILALGSTAISKGYSFVASTRSLPKELEHLLQETMALNQILAQFLALSHQQSSKSARRGALVSLETSGVFDDCKASLESLDKVLAKYQQQVGEKGRNWKKTMTWQSHSKEVNKILLSIQRSQGVLQAAIAVDNAYASPANMDSSLLSLITHLDRHYSDSRNN